VRGGAQRLFNAAAFPLTRTGCEKRIKQNKKTDKKILRKTENYQYKKRNKRKKKEKENRKKKE
jgi:hypothetical protein